MKRTYAFWAGQRTRSRKATKFCSCRRSREEESRSIDPSSSVIQSGESPLPQRIILPNETAKQHLQKSSVLRDCFPGRFLANGPGVRRIPTKRRHTFGLTKYFLCERFAEDNLHRGDSI